MTRSMTQEEIDCAIKRVGNCDFIGLHPDALKIVNEIFERNVREGTGYLAAHRAQYSDELRACLEGLAEIAT